MFEKLGMVSMIGNTSFKRVKCGQSTIHDMAHKHSDESRGYKPWEWGAKVLQSKAMSWDPGVEDIIPESSIASKHLTSTRAYASTVRIPFVARKAGVAKLNWTTRTSVTTMGSLSFFLRLVRPERLSIRGPPPQ